MRVLKTLGYKAVRIRISLSAFVIANKVSSEGQGVEMNVVTTESWQVYIAIILPDEVSKLSTPGRVCYLQLNFEQLNIEFIGSDTKETSKQ